ncbi:MAG: hypothetical protein KDD47_16430, partial [Acidobacteria bacterium]|nr:hypothetical protein [Acidobacteriota bacterium]
HFLFPQEGSVTVIDVEVLRHGDPAEDLGRMSAELLYLFLHGAGSSAAARPLIEHFVGCYVRHRVSYLGEPLERLRQRARFFTAFAAMGIGRNYVVDLDFRRALIRETSALLEL